MKRSTKSRTYVAIVLIPFETGAGPVPFRASGTLLSSAINEFAVHLGSAGNCATTIQSYTQDLKRLLSILGDTALRHISDRKLARAVNLLAHLPIREGQVRSPSTMNRIKSAYRAFFHWCHDTDRTRHNLARHLRMARASSRRTLPITPSEVERFLATIRISADPDRLRDETLFTLYAFTGIRRSEALALRRKDYFFADRLLNLPTSKGGKPRIQVVPSRLAVVLEPYIKHLNENGGCFPDAYLFPGKNPNRPLSVRCIQARFHRWRKQGLIDRRLTIHSFRAGLATWVHRATGDPLLVARLLGHTSMRATERYVEIDDPQLRAALEQVSHSITISSDTDETLLPSRSAGQGLT